MRGCLGGGWVERQEGWLSRSRDPGAEVDVSMDAGR